MADGALLHAALTAYAAAWLAPAHWRRFTAVAAGAAIGLHTAALLARWSAHGHGPFTTMHEILSSSLWSLALVLTLAAWAVPPVRQAWRLVAPLLAVLALWVLVAPAGRGHFPPTYATSLLYLHAVLSKLYLGLLLVAVALGGVPLLERARLGARARALGPADAGPARFALRAAGAVAVTPNGQRCDELAYRFAAFAFVADTLMLVVGAVWAQDAWGRYWAWDPLETWAFATWLALAAALHARATLRPTPAAHGLWLVGVFVLAFLTFFGVPFVSTSPHKGAI